MRCWCNLTRIRLPQLTPGSAAQNIPAATPGGDASKAVEVVGQISGIQRLPIGWLGRCIQPSLGHRLHLISLQSIGQRRRPVVAQLHQQACHRLARPTGLNLPPRAGAKPCLSLAPAGSALKRSRLHLDQFVPGVGYHRRFPRFLFFRRGIFGTFGQCGIFAW